MTASSFTRAAEGVYKWTDSEGRVHYGDMPPPKVNATKLKRTIAPSATSTDAAAPPANAPRTYVEQDVEFRKRRSAQDEATKEQQSKRQETERMQLACADSRGRLRSLQEGGRVYRYNEKGEREYYDAKRFAEEIAKEKKYLDQNCKT